MRDQIKNSIRLQHQIHALAAEGITRCDAHLSPQGFIRTVVSIRCENSTIVARSERPDVILMDMSLPALDGWQATQQLKTTVQTRSIPVIALTAHTIAGDRQKCLEVGCDAYVAKPIDFPQLLEKIQALSQKEII